MQIGQFVNKLCVCIRGFGYSKNQEHLEYSFVNKSRQHSLLNRSKIERRERERETVQMI